MALTLGLALAGQPALAKGSRGGGGKSGGSHASHGGSRSAYSGSKSSPGYGGRGYAAPRTYSTRGSTAERRHPRAGTGRAGRYYGSYRTGSYRPYARGYYGRYYGRYYRPRFYGSLYFGWPYYYSSGPYYEGYYPEYYPAYDAPGYVYDDREYDDRGYDDRGPAVTDYERPYPSAADSGQIRLEVRPDDATVYVDDEFRGTASEVRSLALPAGRHVIEIVRPGFRTERRELDVVTGANPDVLVEMQQPR